MSAERNEGGKPEVERQNGTHSVLICRADHPRGLRGDDRFRGRVCGKRLQVVPFAVRPTYRAVTDWNDVKAGCLVVRCLARDCRAFTEYEVLEPFTDRPIVTMASAHRAEVRRAGRSETALTSSRALDARVR